MSEDHRSSAHTPSASLVDKWIEEYDGELKRKYSEQQEKYGKKRISCEHCTRKSALRNLVFVDVHYTDYSDPQYGQAYSHSEYVCPKCGKVNTMTYERVHLRKLRRFFHHTTSRNT